MDGKYLVQTSEVGEGGSRVLVVFAESLRESGDSSLEPATKRMEPVQRAGKMEAGKKGNSGRHSMGQVWGWGWSRVTYSASAPARSP